MSKVFPAPAAFLVLAFFTVVVTGATAAGSEKAQATTVTLSGWSSSPEENDLLTQVVATFNRTHPNIKVDYTIIQGDYPTAMTARFAAHNPPDVFYVDSSKFPEWARQGVLQPLNSYITKSKYNTPRSSRAFSTRSRPGRRSTGSRRTGHPSRWRSTLDADHRRRQGADDLGPAPVGRPEDGVVERGAERQADLPARRLGSHAPVRLPDRASLANVQSPAVPQRVNFYVGLIKSGLAATPDKLGSGWCGEALGKDKAAIIFEGNWLLPFMKTPPEDPLRRLPDGQGQDRRQPRRSPSPTRWRRTAKNKEAAWTLLSWLTGKQGQKAVDLEGPRAAVAHAT